MDRVLIGYQRSMRFDSLSRFAAVLLISAATALGLAACGSDDSNGGESPSGDLTTTATGATGNTSGSGQPSNAGKKNTDKKDSGKQGNEVIPGKKAPDSAKDKDGKAPDDVISERPGGSKPVSP
jgi:hypothetical protein